MRLLDAKAASVGGLSVKRALPRLGLRTVGPWCFADHFGPQIITETHGLDVGPHPHIGLHTVTWLLAGSVRHNDSLGSDQLIRPGELNLMTAGNGIVHSEQADRQRQPLHGLQLWIAQPENTRLGASAFHHHRELPGQDFSHGHYTLLLGDYEKDRSPVSIESDIVGLDAQLFSGTSTWQLRRDFEYAIYIVSGSVTIASSTSSAAAKEGQLLSLPDGAIEMSLTTTGDARLLLLGGPPFTEPLFMWWNFVARNRTEVSAAITDWTEYTRKPGDRERFGLVASPLPPIPAPMLP